jgi:hypothetical protein
MDMACWQVSKVIDAKSLMKGGEQRQEIGFNSGLFAAV